MAGYNAAAYDTVEYNAAGYIMAGYIMAGFNAQRYDKAGHDSAGFHKILLCAFTTVSIRKMSFVVLWFRSPRVIDVGAVCVLADRYDSYLSLVFFLSLLRSSVL